MFAPEAAMGGVIGRLWDGDTLRISPEEGRIRTGVGARELAGREPYGATDLGGAGYAARYARAALPGLEGAGFGRDIR
jgi:dihydroxyacid dehydratase/phosphogluconate dehydratase